MVHRLRAAMENETFMKLAGEVEADETYVGGKEANRHRRNRNSQNRGSHGNAMVIGTISRKGGRRGRRNRGSRIPHVQNS
jgi:hypothetical protein